MRRRDFMVRAGGMAAGAALVSGMGAGALAGGARPSEAAQRSA